MIRRSRPCLLALSFAAAGVVWLLVAEPASACAACQGGTSDNRVEFILTTALMTFLPLGLIGGILLHLRRRYQALAQQPPSNAPQITPAQPAD